MLDTKAYAVTDSKSPLAPFNFKRRDCGPRDILIEIQYCGVCHSDIHQVRNEWNNANYPMVPGHEIVGAVKKVGTDVKKFKVGDLAGVGCFVDSCRECSHCKTGLDQYCDGHMAMTYNGFERDKKTPTYGGYSSQIVVDENYSLKIPKNLDLAKVAPLLCAGITTYSPLRHCGVGKGHKFAVLGLGGLGHMAVKFGRAFGAEVTVLSSSPSKKEDALKLGAHHFALTKDEATMKSLAQNFDFILDAVAAPHDINSYLELLKVDGTLMMVGVPDKPLPLSAFSLIMRRRKIMGSLIGGIKETQEMLDFCGTKEITSEIEIIPIQKINDAYERMIRGDVRYRFVIDLKTL